MSLCESLTKSGVSPTVALIKKHANQPLPLPEIIGVLRNWKHDPSQYQDIGIKAEAEVADTAANNSDEVVKTLEARIDKLEQQMATFLKSQG